MWAAGVVIEFSGLCIAMPSSRDSDACAPNKRKAKIGCKKKKQKAIFVIEGAVHHGVGGYTFAQEPMSPRGDGPQSWQEPLFMLATIKEEEGIIVWNARGIHKHDLHEA
ncbi:MAG: hypothetical protein FRX49_11701 [Trebouxia sp. A1-2]|nr:MAG: hypothetical protein FRX49_11701 [Trebouxia sp. A1-2]